MDLLNLTQRYPDGRCRKKDQRHAKRTRHVAGPRQVTWRLITEIEKYFRKVIAKGEKGKPGPTVKDPFQKQQEAEMKQRFKTQAGELGYL